MDYDKLKKSRGIAKAAITRIANWVKANKDVETRHRLFAFRFESLKQSFKSYNDIQDEIDSLTELATGDTEDRLTIETQVYDTLDLLAECMEKLMPSSLARTSSPPVAVQQVSSNLDIKLPQISIKPFKGDTSEWQSFIQLFSTLITNNNSLSDIQKFIYLKSFLRDEPLRLINNLTVTNENFNSALQILTDRYENKISVINAHFVSLLEVPPLTKCNATNLREFVTNCKSHLCSLENLKYKPKELYEFLMIYLLGKKLDYGTMKAFETDRDLSELPELSEFFEFIEKRCLVLENLASREVPSAKKPFKPENKTTLHLRNEQTDAVKQKCSYCSGNFHKIYKCHKFKSLQVSERRQFTQSKQLCFNCLGSGHMSVSCSSSRTCSICSKKHNTLLHNTNSQNNQTQGHTPPNSPRNTNSQNVNPQSSPLGQQDPSGNHFNQSVSALSTKHQQVLLATACVKIYDKNGHSIQVKAVLDNGSQNSFVTEKLVKKLNLQPYNKTTNVQGIGLSNNTARQNIDLKIFSNVNQHRGFDINCIVLPVITGTLPHVMVDIKSWNIPDNLSLADPTFMKPSEVDMLIGSDHFYTLLSNGIIRLGHGRPTLIKTQLGWIIGGAFSQSPSQNIRSHVNVNEQSPNVSLFAQFQENTSLEEIVNKFWTIEELPVKAVLSEDDHKVESSFLTSTKILDNGSFQVDLPLKSPQESAKLGDSLCIAKKRFQNLEVKFKKNPDYFKEYQRFINEYVSLGHAKFVPLSPVNELLNPKYFLPHHAVIREDSTTTKLRVVFDASCKTSSGYSLNDIMYKGYRVQPDLFDILLRFRSFKFVLTSDIEKMFRQIKINPKQTFLLNILWRDNSDEPLKCIELSTVTYGTNCAPFLATRVLKQVAQDGAENFPLASEALLTQCYVDDILSGCDSESELTDLYSQLNSLLNASGFKLHKWRSNSNKYLDKKSHSNISVNEMKFDDAPSGVLGLGWHPREDMFRISVPKVRNSGPVTKRKILSTIAQCFDPLGFLSVVIITGKLIIQKLWSLKIDWDTKIEDPILLKEWNEFIEKMPLLENLKIPRFLFENKSILSIQFHGFADASQKAYAACVYARATYANHTVSCNLISSKSRVAPLKSVTLPRLELCAMLLLSKLVNTLISIFENRFKVNSVHLWTDSQIALCWIKSSASRWTVFVANRVSQIQNLTSKFEWRHINSANNAADLPSRGIPIQNVQDCHTWWHGPKFLTEPDLELSDIPDLPNLDNIPEERKATLVATRVDDKNVFWSQLFSKFSSFPRLQRSIAYLLRFISNIKNINIKIVGPLTVNELETSLKFIVKMLQAQHFPKEIYELNNNKSISDKHLAKLTPFLDPYGLLRVGGRLEKANTTFDQKHPLLLPSHNVVVSLMLAQEHRRLGHTGAQTTLSNFRLRFWPLDGLREIKRIIGKCTVCFRFRAQPAEQLMGNLPEDRVNVARCFSRVGVDYGGPFFIKTSKLRRAPVVKCYIAIFVCMVTKAIHIELVSSLSTEGFLMTLKRFISRRGNPSVIYSDNATNFQGASNQIRELYEFFQNKSHTDSMREFLSQNETEFKFIPPRSPHWGGLWEAAVKSAKYHLVRLVGETHFTFEEFYTILTQIEAILNSRPLCAISSDPTDFQFLTPGHFLIGNSLTAYPEKDLSEVPINRLSLWQQILQIHQVFWKRWSTDYLNRLQNRPKWFYSRPNLTIGTMVLLKEDDTLPLKWPLARILEIIPGSDNKVRVVKLQTPNGIFTRSISKICPLPNSDVELPEPHTQ